MKELVSPSLQSRKRVWRSVPFLVTWAGPNGVIFRSGSWVSDAAVDYYTARLTKAWDGHKVNWDSRKQAVSLPDRLRHPLVRGIKSDRARPRSMWQRNVAHNNKPYFIMCRRIGQLSVTCLGTRLVQNYDCNMEEPGQIYVMRGHKWGLRLLGKANLKDALEHWK